MKHLAQFMRFFPAGFDENIDGHALLNIKNIFIRRAIGTCLFFLTVAVQIYRINRIVSFQQMPAHASERRIIQKAVRIDKRYNAFAVFLDKILSVTQKFDIIIVNPFEILFAQFFLAARFFLIIVHQACNPIAFVRAFAAIRRISNHHHHRRLAFDVIRFNRLFR